MDFVSSFRPSIKWSMWDKILIRNCSSAAQLRTLDMHWYIQTVIRYLDMAKSSCCVAVEAGVFGILLPWQVWQRSAIKVIFRVSLLSCSSYSQSLFLDLKP
jgi:hypothetical protein